jgi:very-short-patch-repair endonuclease
MALASPPWGRRERGPKVESYYACQRYHPWPEGHKRKTPPCSRVTGRNDLRRKSHLARTSCKQIRCPFSSIHLPRRVGAGGRSHLHLRAGASVAGFIVDFYCHKAALVVEVDGDIHDLQQEEDAKREKVLREMGLTIIRFRNEDVIKDLPAVVGKVRSLISV